ncbi:hypothetical protein SAMN04488074_13511 [Lentzea albidocapillata subsp. violacea]|uniref:Uncharacterized protein n=1 Tax=Lentzea albidocapillata subsp. violacea TaxID=128104 RepID=A0A1G9YRB2_9PSEU|nr:hypothetical protein [Lentzea albidocapillata]SDN11537.1 hypothetical protein SAMN04488074_13511 [Lentzea albidocapillata subsp. violacea]
MSEYQYYEFIAIDQPLDAQAQAEVRSLSTRARITATSFVNEYHWGDFRGDPSRLMERHYDAHLHLANWGTRRIMLRLPCGLLDLEVAEQYCVSDQVTAWTAGQHLVLSMTSEDESGDWDYDPEVSLSSIVGIRDELAGGDHRALYLAWLAGYGTWEDDEDAFDQDENEELEPLVPPGLRTLTASQHALAGFLRLDDDLLAVAAEASPSLPDRAEDPEQLANWLADLPTGEKDRLLLYVAQGRAATARTEILRRFRSVIAPAVAAPGRRTVADLLDSAWRRRADRQRKEAAQHAEEEARREHARNLVRQKRLDDLSHDEEAAWAKVEVLIATRKPAEYDAAVALLSDLQALAERDDRFDTFTLRSMALRHAHARKPSLIDRLDRARI